MIKFFGLVFLVTIGCINGQTVVKRVFLKNNREYMIDVITDVVNAVEQRGWSNLKLPEMKYELNSTLIFDRNYTGTLTYKNGFLVAVQRLDIPETSFQQIWNTTNKEVKVHVSGQLRMTGVTIGYDIEADLVDGMRRYTGQYTHPLVIFDFWVIRAPVTHAIETKVFGNMQASPRGSIIDIMPKNTESDDFTAMFNVDDSRNGFRSWSKVFHPIFDDVINRMSFPDMCYNCAI
ncbi:hypothetical protein O0L34_g1094 [Tuta absoluta]|nr:hypothetical protein O0L34_g1094 [Tuta absoluta]